LDVVDGRPRSLLVYWYTPPKLCMNPVLENEACLALAVRDERTVESAKARCLTARGDHDE
jgi:hypothetical protein